MIYFFVEGETDSLFIKSLFKNTDIHVYTYSSKKTSKINAYIKTILNMGEKLIFLFDSDGEDPKEKLKRVLEQHPLLNNTNCECVVLEIESWYRAGSNTDIIKKYKLKPNITDTNNYSKESMRREFKTTELLSL